MNEDFWGSFDPKDIADLEARAEKIERDSHLYYDVHMMVSKDGAEEFVDCYRAALMGDLEAMASMMTFAAMVAQSVMVALSEQDETEA